MASSDQTALHQLTPDNSGSDVILTLPNNVTVRQYRMTDVPSLSHHGNNRAIWDNLRNRMPHPYTENVAKEWIDICSDKSKYVPSGPWVPQTGPQGPALPTTYTIAVSDEAIGSISLEFGDAMDIYARTAEIGYWLSEEHWGKGIMGLVVPAFVDWGWRTFGRLIRLNAECVAQNVGSRKVLEKVGFVVEGKQRFGFVKNGTFGDAVFLGMLRPGLES